MDHEGKPQVVAETSMDTSLVAEAQRMAEAEKNMSLKDGIRIFYKGGLWSMTLSLALVMEGYDLGLLTAFYGHPAFQAKFGYRSAQGELYIPANWQAGLVNAVSAGQIIGLLLNGWASRRYGYKKTYLVSMASMVAFIFLLVFATGLPMLLGGALLCGIPWGVFQTLTTAYAAEICPMALRAYMTSFVNICWAAGLFIAAGVVRASITIPSDWGYRMPYMLQWVWPVPLFIACLFAPESPWWLARNNRREDAMRSIARTAVTGYYSERDLVAQVALIDHTHEIEMQETKNDSIFNCFKGTNLRRLEICCVVWSIQHWCGQPVTGYATSFLRNAGLSIDDAFNLNLGNYALLIAGTLLVWYFMGIAGRRTIYLVGIALMAVQLGLIGVLGCLQPSINISYGIGSLMLILSFTFACTAGPTCYTIVGEMPSAEVRSQTIVLARASYVVSGIINSQLTPRMLAPDEFNWGAKTGFFYLGTNILCFIYCYFRLPETKGRTYGELDVLFRNKVPARQFSTTKVEEFEVTHHAQGDVDGDKVDTVHTEEKM